ncbi:hypothetical protein EYV94_12950 [Puteibacter caeruleilacunae]|nr:hypothetical protein EYV94_12950 [Puteibacter caeruleilacunae]
MNKFIVLTAWLIVSVIYPQYTFANKKKVTQPIPTTIQHLPSEQIDWFMQDFGSNLKSALTDDQGTQFLPVIHSISKQVGKLSAENKSLMKKAEQGNLDDRMKAYLELCKERRSQRLKGLIKDASEIVFLENTEFGNAPRLNMSMVDGPYKGQPFKAGAAIHKLSIDKMGKVTTSTLLDNNDGMIRDLDVSFDGKRILFAQKEDVNCDWQIYEMNISTGDTRKLTKESGIANIQPRYLPDGILFHSTRCVTVVDCNESIDAVNIYRADKDGKDIKRLTYDQVSTQFPSLLSDGRVIFTRWEYNDRGQVYPQALFSMYPDGTRQTAFYGNNSWYPTSLIQARGIDNSKKVVAIMAGHHTEPMGKLALIDVTKGQEEGKGVELIAPERDIEYKHKDVAEQEDVLFQYPYPINLDEYIVGCSLYWEKRSKHFGIYWVNRKGERELLVAKQATSVRHPMPLVSRPLPRMIPSTVDYSKRTGSYYVSNIYYGPGLKGVKPGTIKSLRVVALDYRSSGIRTNDNCGEGGNARVTTPISVGGAWDTKTILGEAKVHDDGSCYFKVPANTPVYFQAVDANGEVVHSMRSWSTLMPGENFSCVGCHESKLEAPVNTFGKGAALKAGLKPLQAFYDVKKGFSYPDVIQPILDRHCVRCHNGESIRETIHQKNAKHPAYGVFTRHLADAERLTNIYTLPEDAQIQDIKLTWEGKATTKWKLRYLNDDKWITINITSSRTEGSTQIIGFDTIKTNQFRLDVFPGKETLKLQHLQFIGKNQQPISWRATKHPFNLTGNRVDEPISGRQWSESYLRLIKAGFIKSKVALDARPNDLTNWISPQSRPTMLAPYEVGSSQSRLIDLLESGHNGVELNKEELDKLRAWIDLGVPFCGTYDEANIWSHKELEWFKHQNQKRKAIATQYEKQQQ